MLHERFTNYLERATFYDIYHIDFLSEVPERVEEKEVFDAFRKQLAENKPKKGKGKKGGKKKKKKG